MKDNETTKEKLKISSGDSKSENDFNIMRESMNNYMSNIFRTISLNSMYGRNFQEIIELLNNLQEEIDKIYKIEEKEIYKKKDLTNLLENLEKSKDLFFRGESQNNWPLIPSLLRRNEKKGEYIYDIKSNINIEEYYLNELKAYNEIISKRGMSYDFMAYMQHAKQKSIFIDFSKNLYIALSFALKIENFFLERDLVLYVCKPNNKEISVITDVARADELLEQYKLKILDDINSDAYHYIIDIPQNDRMKYQQGVFLFRDSDLVLSEDVDDVEKETFKSLNTHMEITKYIISWKHIPFLMKNIYINHSHYEQEKLMNPYDIFVEK